ncbi:interferon regulatory factor 1-like [Mercenaria mercenaria]|uniref:interferon regulatory factor 1-like n=1 Tax=Mercenaria mercenaria TaxID=6596 RepID=UPI001E1DAD6C|nr:interferon regulatory factor 1-like [Mercenaria mercenaria]
MPRGRPKSKNSCKGRATLRTIDRKPIRPLERQRMRPWLMDLLDKRTCHQLVWMNKKDKTFRVSWKHAAGQTFDPAADATLFELWARHTGKYYPGDRPDPKKWKANFRCALHSVPDVEEDKSLGVRRGNNAYRVYKFLDEKRIRKPSIKKEKDEKSSDEDSEFEDFAVVRNLGTRSRPKKIDEDEFDSEGSETGYSPSHESNHSDWDLTTEDLRRQDHDTEAERSPLPNFEELCQSCPNSFSNRIPKKQKRVPDIPTLETMNAVQNLQTMETEIYTRQGPAVTDHTYTETEQSEGELILFLNYDTVDQDMAEESDYMEGFWNSVIDTSLDVQEEVVSSGDCFDGPSVIVMEETDKSYDYEYTSLSQL